MKAADDRLSKGIGTGEFMCVYWPSRGQEAIAAAMGVTLRDDDQLVTTYRGLHDLIGKGVPLEEIYGEMMGRTVGASRGKGGTMHIAKPEKGVMLSTGIVGAGPPVSVGLAMAAKRKGLDRVTVVSFGDGATNTGSFHEAANMAALWDLPMVFVCQNNMYAEMTPTTDTMKIEHVADRAAGYGMPGVRVDGNDPLAVADALAEAIGKARDGDGPTFIECVTFRFRGHYFGDRMPYIPKEQLEAAMAADPVPAFRRSLIDGGICSDDELSGIDEGAQTLVEEALKTVVGRGVAFGRRARPRRVRRPDQVPRLRNGHGRKRDVDARGAEPRARSGDGRRRPGLPARRGHRRPRRVRPDRGAVDEVRPRPRAGHTDLGGRDRRCGDRRRDRRAAAGRRDHDHGLHRHRGRPAHQQRRQAAVHDRGPDDRADHRPHPGVRRSRDRGDALADARSLVHAHPGDEGHRAVHAA